MLFLQIIILMIFIFGGLLFLLHHILTKNISTATTHLDEMNAEFIRKEEEIKKRQSEAENYYEDMVARAKEEAEKVKQDAEKEAQQRKEAILDEARTTSEQVIKKAEKTKDMLTNELRHEMEEKITSKIRDVIRGVLPVHLMEELHRLWLADLLESSLSKLSQLRLPEDITQIKIVSAFPLSPAELKALSNKFKDQLNRDFAFKEELDPSLIGGVVLVMGSVVLDGSIANKIEKKIGDHA